MKKRFGQPVQLARRLTAKREFRLFRYGDNPSTKGTYRLTRDSAKRLIQRWRTRGLKVTFDYDHAALKKDTRPGDGRSAGKCDIELRSDGLWCTNVEWTPTALKGIEEGEWVYFSPAFLPDEETGEIEELVNVALTNIPAMDGIEALAASRNGGSQPKEQKAMKLSQHLAAYSKGGGKLEDVSKGTGIHVDRMKQLHDGDGDAPSQEEMKALAKHFKMGPEQCKEIFGEESNLATGDGPTPMSAVDGQDPDNMEGEGDDEVEHEDLSGGKPTLASRGADKAALVMLRTITGTSDPKKQAARLKALHDKSILWEEDHKAVVAMKEEREMERRNRLIEKGKEAGQLTPASLKYWSRKTADELEEYLKVAPRVLHTRSSSYQEADPDTADAMNMTREDLEAAKLFGISDEEFGKGKKLVEAQGEMPKRRREMMTYFDKLSNEGQVVTAK